MWPARCDAAKVSAKETDVPRTAYLTEKNRCSQAFGETWKRQLVLQFVLIELALALVSNMFPYLPFQCIRIQQSDLHATPFSVEANGFHRDNEWEQARKFRNSSWLPYCALNLATRHGRARYSQTFRAEWSRKILHRNTAHYCEKKWELELFQTQYSPQFNCRRCK